MQTGKLSLFNVVKANLRAIGQRLRSKLMYIYNCPIVYMHNCVIGR